MSRCQKNRSDNQPCQAQAVAGTDACRVHAGRSLAEQRARGQVVVTLRRWGVDDIPEDPGTLLLKLMTVTSWRQAAYEAEIARILDDTGLPLSEALIGDAMVVDKFGEPHKVGEYVRGIVELEQAERKLAADLAMKALAAGVQERLTRVQEQVGQLLMETCVRFLGRIGRDDPASRAILAEELRAIGAVA